MNFLLPMNVSHICLILVTQITEGQVTLPLLLPHPHDYEGQVAFSHPPTQPT